MDEQFIDTPTDAILTIGAIGRLADESARHSEELIALRGALDRALARIAELEETVEDLDEEVFESTDK
jgi:predicted  nucleic acid-binding Zn-ribbon protein